MIAYPIMWEVYDAKFDPTLVAKFTAYDEDCFNIKIDDKGIDSENLKKIAELLEIAENQLREGIEK